MTSRAIGMIARTVVASFAAAVFGALSFAVAASAQAPAKPSPKAAKPPVLTITITGPGVSPPIVIRSTEDPTLYDQVAGQVSWMKSASGNVMPSTPTQLGPHYTVTMTTGRTRTGVYDLYPLVVGGPRAHRAAVGSQRAAWFFAPVSMASGLEAAGVTFPTSSASGEIAPPTVATSAPSTSFSKIMAQSKIALGLAALAAAGVLVTLALAARRSRRLDRRRAMPAALARLENVANRARGATGLGGAAMATSGPGLRQAFPAARAEGTPVKATGTARVKPPSQPTNSPPDAGPASAPAIPVTGDFAPMPPEGGSPLVGPAQSPGQSELGPPGPPGPPAPSGPSGDRPTGGFFSTFRADQRRADKSRTGSVVQDHPGSDVRPPAPRASAEAPSDSPADTSVAMPVEIVVGTAHVIATSRITSSAPPNAAGASSAEVTPDADVAPSADRAIGVAPAPRGRADDVIEPEIDGPHEMLGRVGSADSTSVVAGSETATPEVDSGEAEGDPIAAEQSPPGLATAEQEPAEQAPAVQAPAEQAPAEQEPPDDEQTEEPPAEATVAEPASGPDDVASGTANPTDRSEGDGVGEEDADQAEDADAGEVPDDESDPLDAAHQRLPVTSAPEDETDIATSTATSGSDADDSAAATEPDSAVAAPVPAVPADSARDHDASAADAGPAEPNGERP